MSRRFPVYLRLQCRRARHLLPRVLAVTLLLILAAALAGTALFHARENDPSLRKTRVGVVTGAENAVFRAGVHALETFDSSRYEVEFLFLEEAEAAAALRAGELSAYLAVPDDFVESVYAGDVRPIRYVSRSGAAGIDAALLREIADAVSRLMLESENAQYGVQRYVLDHLPEADPYEADAALVERYFSLVLARDGLFRVETVGVSGALSYAGYYLCALAVAFLLLWGLAAAPLFAGRSEELSLLLRARGFGGGRQILGEFPAYLALMLPGALCAAGAAAVFLRRAAPRIPELGGASPAALGGALLLCILMLSAMQFFLYELAPSAVGGTPLQFLAAAVMGYLCGCFYPYGFFPEAVQRLGALLPPGVGLRLLGGVLSGGGSAGYALAALGYTALFLALAALVRNGRLAKGAVG